MVSPIAMFRMRKRTPHGRDSNSELGSFQQIVLLRVIRDTENDTAIDNFMEHILAVWSNNMSVLLMS